MTDVLSRSLVRILRQGDDAIMGIGFLVADHCVLTCTHVVNKALGRQGEGVSSPETSVTLDFPLLASGTKQRAHVCCWFPEQADGSGDIALLRLDGSLPSGATGVRLLVAGDHQGHIFQACGFPSDYDHGIWATGVLRGPTAAGWVQLEDVKRQGYAIQQGFSGGAVWDEQCEGVVGMVVAVDTMAETKVAFMIPSSLLVKTCPVLQPSVIDDLKNYLQVGIHLFSRLPHYYPPGLDFVQIRQYVRLLTKPLFYQDEQASSRRPDESFTEQEVEAPPLDWEELRIGLRRGIILGEPGMGKSWLLHHEWLRAAKKFASLSGDNDGEQQALELPLYLRLPLLAEALATGKSNAYEAILRVLEREYGWHQRFVRRVKNWLTHGHCLLCCDGLDEVAHEQREVLALALEQVAREDGHRMLITSRSTGYRSPFRTQGDVQEFELVGLEQAQMGDFIECWFSVNTVRARQLQELLQREPALRALASSPLLLSFLCRIYDTGGRVLPTTQSVLFERVLRLLLESTWHDSSSLPNEERLEQKLTLLKQIAWHFAHTEDHWQFVFPASALTTVLRQHRDGLTTLPPHQSLLEELSVRDGVLVKAGATPPHLPVGEVPYTFLHRTFHEYLVACALADQTTGMWKEVVLAHCWFEPEWENVIILLAGRLKQPQMLIETLRQEPDDALHHLLLLSARCLVEVDRQRVRVDLRQQVANTLLDLVRSSLWDGMHQWASVLGQIGEPTVIPALVQALGEPRIRMQLGAMHALALMQGKMVEETMLQLLQDEQQISLLRQEAVKALGRMAAVQAIPYLVRIVRHDHETHYWGKDDEVAQALKAIGEPAVKALWSVVEDSTIDFNERRFAAIALGSIGQAAGQALLAVLGTLLTRSEEGYLSIQTHPSLFSQEQLAWRQMWWQERMVLEAVVEALGYGRNGQVRQTLSNLLHHQDSSIRGAAIKALGMQGDAGEELLQAVLLDMDEEPALRLQVAELLARRGSEETIEALLNVVYDETEDSDLRQRMIEQLGTIGDTAAVEELCDILDDEDDVDVVRAAALFALSEIGDASLVIRLSALVRDGDEEPNVRLAAAQALGRTGDATAITSLLEVLQGSNEDELREAVVEALGAVGDASAVAALLLVAQDQDTDIQLRATAIGALGTIGDASAVQGLTTLLQKNTEERLLRQIVVQALGAIGDSSAIKTMLHVRADETTDIFLRHALEEALPKLIAPDACEDYLALLKEEPQDIDLQRRAVQGLGEIGDTRAVEALLPILQERREHQQIEGLQDWQISNYKAAAMLLRCDAAEALGKIGDAQAVEGLLASLIDTTENQSVRDAAAEALGRIGGVRAMEGLFQVFQHGDMGMNVTTYLKIMKTLERNRSVPVIDGLLQVLQTSQDGFWQTLAGQSLQHIVEQGDDLVHLADALLTCWEQASTMQVTDEKAHTFALTVHCELLMLLRYQLRAAVGDDWPLWRKRLMGPTRSMRMLGKRVEGK